MLIISSDDDLADHSPLKFMSMTHVDSGRILNLLGDYRYLRMGYYISLHAELLNVSVIPAIKDILDAYRPPLFLSRAKNVGISTTPFNLVTETPSDVGLPCVLIAVNPFTTNSIRVAKSKSSLIRNIKALSYDGRYTVCVQPLLGKLQEVELVLGHTREPECAAVAKQVFNEFKIPLGKLVIQQTEEMNFLCHFLPTSGDGLNSQWIKDVLAVWRKAGAE